MIVVNGDMDRIKLFERVVYFEVVFFLFLYGVYNLIVIIFVIYKGNVK